MTARKSTKNTEIEENSVNNDETVKDAPNPKLASKTGRRSWKPAQLLTVKNKTPGYGYSWVEKDSDNVRRKLEEGWVHVTKTAGFSDVTHERPEGVEDGGPMCSDDTEYRELVLMAMPDDIVEARKEYQAEKVREATHQSAKGEVAAAVGKLGGGDAPKLHGGLTFD